jgi:hypothetical protein
MGLVAHLVTHENLGVLGPNVGIGIGFLYSLQLPIVITIPIPMPNGIDDCFIFRAVVGANPDNPRLKNSVRLYRQMKMSLQSCGRLFAFP